MAPEARITGVETRSYRYPLEPPFRAAWDPLPRTHQDATLVLVHIRRRRDRIREAATTCPTARCSSASSSGSTRCARRRCARSARRSTSTAVGPGRPSARSGTSPGACWTTPVWRLLGGRNERVLAYASSGELVDPDERARRAVALKRRGRARPQAALPPRRLARGRGGRRARARRGGRRLRAHGRRQPGLAHARRPRDALGCGDRGPRARASSNAWARTGWRSRCAATTWRATARCGA